MKKLLLIGQGQIGSAITLDMTDFDIHVWREDIDALSSEIIKEISPDAIVNAAGKTDLSWCEANAREAVRVNLEAPVRLYQRMTALRGVAGGIPRPLRFIHFSSGCIWDGPYTKSGQPFTPQLQPTPACLYTWTKAAADAMLLDLDPKNIAILRPRQVYSASNHPRSTLVKLLRYPKLIDTPNSVTSIAAIEKTLRMILTIGNEWNGVWNVYDRGVTTPFHIGKMLYEAGLREEPQPLSKEELDRFHTPKRVDTVLYDARYERMIQPEDVQTQLGRAIEELKKSFKK
ncbi:MAG TPA: sugar nucleotide-binding protein [Candidatus Kapabacteria bacterium]